ncbi:hypothetical protein VPH35_116382 [Triticum aestivum]
MPPVTLNDDVFTEILLRLPPKSVFRSRAVCKLWRSITTCASFVAAYSRRRPLELLVYPDAYKPSPGSKNAVAAVSLDAGFYFHRPSGEYRVLCDGSERRSPTDPQINRGTHHMCHYVLSTSGAGPRRLGPFDETPDGDGRAHVYSDCGVVVSGTLYWAKHSQLAETSMNMLAFDTRPARLLELDRLEDEYHRLFEPKDRDRSLHFGGPSGRNSRPLNEAVATLEGDMLAVFASGWVVLYDMKEKKMGEPRAGGTQGPALPGRRAYALPRPP